MRKLAVAVVALAFTVPLGARAKDAADPMAAWKPRKVMNAEKDKKEIGALFMAMHEAGKKGDVDAAAALVDFPVLMVTDDSQGQAMSDSWTREKWLQVMKPFYSPHPEMKVKHKPAITLLTDSLATIADEATITMGKKTVTARSSTMAIRKDGKWLIKAMVEGGWGDMMKEQPTSSAQPGTAPSGTGTGSGASSGMGTSGSSGAGTGMGTSGASPPGPATGTSGSPPGGPGMGTGNSTTK
jgi:Domain of unknown function (DUF4440)